MDQIRADLKFQNLKVPGFCEYFALCGPIRKNIYLRTPDLESAQKNASIDIQTIHFDLYSIFSENTSLLCIGDSATYGIYRTNLSSLFGPLWLSGIKHALCCAYLSDKNPRSRVQSSGNAFYFGYSKNPLSPPLLRVLVDSW